MSTVVILEAAHVACKSELKLLKGSADQLLMVHFVSQAKSRLG
jgi:hypothetical protein